jgi:membrane protease subunit (stomatin/prohibitin family)
MPLIRRGGRPGLLGTVARTAVIAGTANAVTTRHQERAQQRAAQQQAAATPAPDDLVAQIQRLGDLHAAGTLTDDEFAAAKARLLG